MTPPVIIHWTWIVCGWGVRSAVRCGDRQDRVSGVVISTEFVVEHRGSQSLVSVLVGVFVFIINWRYDYVGVFHRLTVHPISHEVTPTIDCKTTRN